MTYSEFKKQLRILLAGDTDMRNDDEAVLFLYMKAVGNILAECEPLALITADRERFTPYRALDDVYFIRQPSPPASDGEALEMDERLSAACVYLVAADIVKAPNDVQRRMHYLGEAARIKDQHRFETFCYLQDSGYFQNGFYEQGYMPTRVRRDLPLLLDRWGLLKFYRVYKDIGVWRYDWDMEAIDTLDKFMWDGDGALLSPSRIALWDQFCAWQDEDVSNDPETKALKILDGIYLARSGADGD